MINNLHLQLIDLNDSNSITQADTLLLTFMQRLNCGNFTYNYYANHFSQSNAIEHSLCTHAMQAWQVHYHQHNYEFIDPMLSRIRQSRSPFGWKLDDEMSRVNKQESKVYRDAIEFGLQGGFAIPIHGPRGEFANLVVQDLAAHQLLAHHPEAEYFLQMFAHRYHAKIFQLLNQQNLSVTLTQREKQCLQLTAKHLTAKQIAKQLGITPRTVGFHLENIIYKLQVKNKHEAVSYAAMLGLF